MADMQDPALHALARQGAADRIVEALQAGADIDARNANGATALMHAIAYKQPDAALLLIQRGASVTAQNNDGSTALHHAVEYRLPALARALLEQDASLANICDKHGNGPLWTAAFGARGSFELVELLLRFGADRNHRNRVNLSPMDIPAKTNQPDLQRVLEGSAKRDSPPPAEPRAAADGEVGRAEGAPSRRRS